MIDAVHRYGGDVASSLTGDGIFAVFGAPIALEDLYLFPQHALLPLCVCSQDLRSYSNRLREHGEPPVLIRIGVNVGESGGANDQDR